MKARALATILAMAVLAGLVLSATPAGAAPGSTVTNQVSNIPVSGNCESATTGAEGTFNGTLSLTGFSAAGRKLVANGTLSGTCSAGGTLASQQVTVPVRITQQGTCEVLTLVLGPLHLELLGLIVDLNQVVLTITADAAGGLLGQLLCSLAGGGGGLPLQQIIGLLNQILAILQGL
jgi:hypothetical protein